MFCVHCGQEMDKESKFCPSCGKPRVSPVEKVSPEGKNPSGNIKNNSNPRSKKGLPVFFIVFLVFVIGLIFISVMNQKGEVEGEKSSKIQENNKRQNSVETEIKNEFQSKFEYEHSTYCNKYNNGINEIQKSETYRMFKISLPSIKNKINNEFIEWTGVITKISTDKGGDNLDVTVKVGIIKLFELVINRENPIYQQVFQLRVGDKVKFTGRFFETNSLDKAMSGFLSSEKIEVCRPSYSVNFISISR